MQNQQFDDEDDKPLDPVLEKVRKKMLRLLAVSLGIMFAGIMALLIAIVYKATGEDESAQTASQSTQSQMIVDFPKDLEIILPLGFSVRNFDLDGSRAAVYGVGSDDAERVIIVDLLSGDILSTIVLRK